MSPIAPGGSSPSRRPRTRGRAVVITGLGLLVALVPMGCSPSGSSGSDASGKASARRGHYEPMTEGPVEDLVRHIRQLEQQFQSVNERGPIEARASLLEYLDAVAATAQAIVMRDGVNTETRDQSAGAWLKALGHRLAADRTRATLDRVNEAADTIIEKFPHTLLATNARYAKLDILQAAPPQVISDPDEHFNLMAEAALELGKADPPSDKAADILTSLGYSLELRGQNDRALQFYKVLVENFPEHETVPLARGTIYRLELEGQAVGEIKGKNLKGEPVSLSDYAGKVVLVDFWATWCGPCLQEIPELKRLRETLGPDQFEVLAICADRDRKMVTQFLDQQKLPWPQIILAPAEDQQSNPFGIQTIRPDVPAEPPQDPDAEPDEVIPPGEPSELERRFGAGYLPLKLVVDREGRLVASGHQLDSVLDPLAALFPDKLVKPEIESPEGASPAK